MSEYIVNKCSSCRRLSPAGNYCIFCGASKVRKTIALEKIECVNCGHSTPLRGKYCVKCGGALHE
jgi:DNA-directed RNA polymerase subunit RPC12/RpoP